MQMDPEVRPDAVECIEVISKHLRLPQNGSGKFRDAPMRASSGRVTHRLSSLSWCLNHRYQITRAPVKLQRDEDTRGPLQFWRE